ncbi:serine/threonine kinase 16 [Lineolata rhizophorae]|uniref:Serine/threonine kinase 16 n=1 Tax=Lineolata rhizophorae TaxID=578093 RepID=A0A6A6P4R7_9PEZI|nr:serine/threonine kinase 16 [Lineolata rhizophorae]
MEMNYDDKELHQIEEELHVEILPGTEVMADIGTHHFVKAEGHGNRVLVPQPSDDPHDPLNWSIGWKAACITASTWTTFTQGFGPLALAPMFPYYIEEFNCTLEEAVQFTGVCILVLGFSNFIWVPLSSSFGRRFVYITSQVVNLGSMIWRAEAHSYGSFMGACVLNGIAAGPAESIQPAVIADIFFLHDRGKWNTLYWTAYMGSLMVAPIISGPMADTVGWRAFWWLNVAMIALSIAMNATMFPETKWHRKHPKEIIREAREAQEAAKASGNDSSAKPTDEKLERAPSSSSQSKREDINGIAQVPTAMSRIAAQEGLTKVPTADQDPWLGRGSPKKSQWNLIQPNKNPFKSILLDLFIPWKLFLFPIVEFSAFVVSWACSTFLQINLTQSQAFEAPPYNFSAQSIGFMNFAILVGALIGLATAGPLSDWVSARATRRNRGIREPEMRLPAMIPYVIIMFVGAIINCVGYDNHWPWEAIVIVGFTTCGITVASLPAIATTYAIDSYKPVAGSLMVAITVNKNVWGYGLSKFITEWAISDGFVAPIMTNSALCLVFCLFGILFYYKGKTIRRWSKNSSVHSF